MNYHVKGLIAIFLIMFSIISFIPNISANGANGVFDVVQDFQGEYNLNFDITITGAIKVQDFSSEYQIIKYVAPIPDEDGKDLWNFYSIVDLGEMINAMIWLLFLFLPGLVLNFFVPKLGMLIGLGISNTVILMLNFSFMWVGIIIYAYLAVIVYRGGVNE